MIWAIVGGVLVAMFVSGCDKGDDGDTNTGVGGDGDAVKHDADDLHDDGDALLPDEDTVPVFDSRDCPGINAGFAKRTSAYRPCPFGIDLKVSGDRLFGACGPNYNGVFTIRIDPEDPLASKGMEVVEGAPAHIVGQSSRILAAQAVAFAGGMLVPFAAADKPELNGISFAGAGGAVETMLFGRIPATETTAEIAPVNPRAAAVVAGADGVPRLVIPVSDANAGGRGQLLSADLYADGSFNRHAHVTATALAGRMPAAMAMLGSVTAMILHASGDDGPTIEFFDVAANATIASVAVPEEIVALPQIALSEDHAWAVIPAASGALHIFDVAARQFTGSLAGTEPARGLAVSGTTAYASFEHDLRIVDFANPALPAVALQVGVGSRLGPVAVRSGIVYVSATGLYDEEAEVAQACIDGDPLAVCNRYLVAIDPSKLPTGAWSPDDGFAEICPRAE